jgi:RimJ/RimL family protein N-acetyltransferase
MPLAESDLPDLCALHCDERIVAAFGATAQSEDETREFLERKLAHWQKHGFGIWMFRDAHGAFVGRCGLHRWRGEVELGYVVRSQLWNQGFATEIAGAVASRAFTDLGLRELVAFTREENTASRRVIEKAGFVYERDFLEDGVRSVLYRLTDSTIRARPPSLSAGSGL